MSDFQRVVEFLRDVRQGPLQSVDDEITQLAADYARLIVQANERLRKCSTFLQQGLRSEAIHLAEENPNLLDLVAALDLPDQQAWAEFCQNNALAVPPPLALDRAAQLNDAYAQDQPLEHLLSRHRLLALARGPVRDRLDTLRKISQVDAGNENWQKDVRTFERARLNELPNAFYTAVKNKDDAGIIRLMEELNQPWSEAIPADLTAAVTDAYGRVQRARAEAELKPLVEPLRDAYAARSLQECQALVQRWKNIMASAGVEHISTELTDEIRPVLTFITEQTKRDELLRRFRDSCKAFSQLLDKDAPDAQLEAGYAKLQQFNEEIPEEITARYTAKKAGRRQSVERGHKQRLAAFASVAAAVIAIACVVAWLYTSSLAANRWADEIKTALMQHSQAGLDTAQNRFNELQKSKPALLKEPVVAAAVTELQTQQSDFARDKDTLRTLLRDADSAQAKAAPVVNNPAATMTEVSAAAGALQTVLNHANASAKTLDWVDPGNTLTAAAANLRASLGNLKDRVTAIAKKEIDAVAIALDAVPTAAATPDAARLAREAITTLADRLNAVRALPLLDDDTQSSLAALSQKVTQRREGADVSRSVADALENIRRHAGSAADLRSALEAFTARFPDDPASKDFATAIQRTQLALGIDDWGKLTKTFNAFSASSLSATQKRLDAVNAYLGSHADSPLSERVTRYADYLRLATEAMGDKGPWQTGFADLLGAPTLSELAVMEVSDGRKYFVLGDVKRTEHRLNNQLSISFDALNLKDLTKRIPISIEPGLSVSNTPVLTPHAKFLNDVADNLKLINESNWDTFGIDVADRLVKNDQVDLVVKAMILLQTLKTQNTVTGWALEDFYEKSIADLSRQSPDTLPWMEPTKISEGTRKALKQAIDGIPPAAAARQEIAAAKDALFRSLAFTPAGTGVLLKDDKGAWTIATQASPAAGSVAWTVLPAETPPGPGTLLQLGKADGTAFSLDESHLRGLPQGSIVYITRP